MIDLYTDGSVQLNGKPDGYAGWAMVHDRPGKLFVRYGHFKPTSTNGRGEIGGVLYGMATFWKNRAMQLNFISDAKYVVNSVNLWRFKPRGNQIKNHDMLYPLYDLWDAHGHSTINWVKGHSGVRGNEIADEWADKGCRQIVRDMHTENADIRFISNEEYDKTVAAAMAEFKSSKVARSPTGRLFERPFA